MYKDNDACVTQMQAGYIKSNIAKHISPKLFYPRELQQTGEINIFQTKLICLQSHYQVLYLRSISM
jgi:hypothetical protein